MDEPRRRIEDAITVLVAGSPAGLTRTSLVKLLYFVDLRGWERLGRPVTALRWTWHHYGPYADEIFDVVGELEVADEVTVSMSANYFGSPEYRIASGRAAGLYRALSGDDEAIIADVLRQFGSLSPSMLTRYSYQTPPIIEAQQRGEELEFSMYASVDKPPDFVPDPSAAASPKMDSSWMKSPS
jgi:uncharacterized phage-associated protein